MTLRLPAERLLTRCDVSKLSFATTAELADAPQAALQPRALEAIRFAIDVGSDGYNLFVMGPVGIGKHALAREVLAEQARNEPVPADWCYVHNFTAQHRPQAISLPAGRGAELRSAMKGFVEELQAAIPAAFESEQYRRRMEELEEEFKEHQEQAFEKLSGEAEQQGIRLMRTPAGFVFAPLKNGEVVDADAFARLSAEEQAQIRTKLEALQARMQEFMRGVSQRAKESRDKAKDLNREVALAAVGHLISELKTRFGDHAAVVSYLEAVEADVLQNVGQFRKESPEHQLSSLLLGPAHAGAFDKYAVNLFVDNSATVGAPVITENHPTYQNLVGRVEQQAHMGALITDFSLVKAGSLHRANGGYLLLDARKVLMQPFAWEALKMVLETGTIRIESPGQMLSLVSTVSLEPEHIPFAAKIVLLGDRMLHHLLYNLDPDFHELFKVSADFEERIDRDSSNDDLYAVVIASIARKLGLRHFDRTAVARVIEEGARLVGDAEKMTTQVDDIANLLRESSYWCGKAGRRRRRRRRATGDRHEDPAPGPGAPAHS